jgi:hypothetical protein
MLGVRLVFSYSLNCDVAFKITVELKLLSLTFNLLVILKVTSQLEEN